MAQRKLVDLRYELLSLRFFVLGVVLGGIVDLGYDKVVHWVHQAF